jgi:hypothetical protein
MTTNMSPISTVDEPTMEKYSSQPSNMAGDIADQGAWRTAQNSGH